MLGSRTVLRAAVLIGLSSAAWLAGVAAAHAEPVASDGSEIATSTQPSAEVTPVIDPVAAESEQAALTPANQLESATSSILDVPNELLETAPKSSDSQATTTADASADVTATDTIDQHQPPRDVDETGDEPQTAVNSALAPLAAAVKPLSGNLTAVNAGVGQTLNGVTQPLSAVAAPVDSAVSRLAPAGQPGMYSMLLPLAGGTDIGSYSHPDIGRDGVSTAHDQPQVNDSAESVHSVMSKKMSGDDRTSLGNAHKRASDPAPFTLPVRSNGSTGSDAMPASGPGLGGQASIDSGATSYLGLVHTDRNAVVSRVTPKTAVYGQLPDHVADPAVSPD